MGAIEVDTAFQWVSIFNCALGCSWGLVAMVSEAGREGDHCLRKRGISVRRRIMLLYGHVKGGLYTGTLFVEWPWKCLRRFSVATSTKLSAGVVHRQRDDTL